MNYIYKNNEWKTPFYPRFTKNKITNKYEYNKIDVIIYYLYIRIKVSIGLILLIRFFDHYKLIKLFFNKLKLNHLSEIKKFSLLFTLSHLSMYIYVNFQQYIFKKFKIYEQYRIKRLKNQIPDDSLINETLIHNFVGLAGKIFFLIFFYYIINNYY